MENQLSCIESQIELFLEHFKSAQSGYLERSVDEGDNPLDVSTPDCSEVKPLTDVVQVAVAVEGLCTELTEVAQTTEDIPHHSSTTPPHNTPSGQLMTLEGVTLRGQNRPNWADRRLGCNPRVPDKLCGGGSARPTVLQLVLQDQSTTSPSSDYVSSTSSFASIDSSSADTPEFTSLRSSYRSFYGSFGTIWFPTRDYVMGESGCSLTILDVADLLQTSYAYVSGGKSKSGAQLLTFPDTHHDPELTENQYRQLVCYLTSIPSLQDADSGYTVVIDRRKDKWSAVKSLLNKISDYFPGPVQEVVILKPSGFFQKTFGNLSSVKENHKFKLHLLTGTKDLRDLVDTDQLTSDLGGDLQYDHKIWINERAAVEKFSANTSRIGDTLSCWCKKLQTVEFPNTVPATKQLIEEQEITHSEIVDDLQSTLNHGDILLKCFKTVTTGDGKDEEVETSVLPQYKLVHVTCIERLLAQLDETRQGFCDFWLKHEKKLVQCLQLRQFEDDFRSLHAKVCSHVEMLSKMTDSGDTMQHVHTLLEQLREFEESTQLDVEEAERLWQNGKDFIEDNHYAVDCIRPKCLELQRACSQYREITRQRRELLKQSEELQERIDRANSWCNDGISLLANQQLDKFNTSAGAKVALCDVDTFLSTSGEFELGDFDNLQHKYEPVLSPVHKVNIEETLKKIGNVHEMCEKRRNSLQRLISKTKPTVVVQPQQSQLYKHSTDYMPDNLFKNIPTSSPPLYPSSSPTLDTDSSQQGHVMRELLETERTYVFELSSVLEGYKDALDKPTLKHLIPEGLRGQGDVLFGNLENIYSFHAGEFIKELEGCRDQPAAVGRCFINRKEDFSVYSVYCQNKPASEALICEVRDNNPFFKHCQTSLGHKLPLSAYLLKPVQRITKYQLLLKEMLKNTSDICHQKELQEAISTMVTVLRYVNDVMHASSIIGFPGRFSQQGKLLLQGSFSMSYENKKDKTVKDQLSRLKTQQRHVFVYENSVIFCKKRDEKPENSRQGAPRGDYLYKSSLEMSTIGLTESVRGDRRKFELWKGQRTVVYTLLAPSVEVKDIWVREIKTLLLLQFDKIKQKSMRDVPTVPLKRIFEHSPSVSSPTGKVVPTESFGDNNNDEDIVQTASQPLSQGNQAMEVCYDDTSWSSSDGFPDFTALENIEGGYKYFTVLADYNAMSHTEVTMHEGEIVEVIQVGHQGWWLVRLGSEMQGWVPASYLEPAKRRSTISSNSGQSSVHSTQSLQNSQSTGSFGKDLPAATEV